ncbi:MAG: ABC transporter ATP-binding protein [Alphaproteobacteria bacterium]
MSVPILKLKNVDKSFPLYRKTSERLCHLLFRRPPSTSQPALSNIHFDIYPGETIGIVGHNGAGKSTLLQIICGTMSPSNGSVVAKGQIASILELGTGFSPALTGRENIYINAAILGMKKKEVDAALQDIIAFADIGHYIEQPVRTYSSGMLLRLAFAIAIHTHPEILVIDEALSVGDEGFQRKCFSYLEAFKAKGGTLIVVSHAMKQIIGLCDRALLLDKGEILCDDTPSIIVNAYQKLLFSPLHKRGEIRDALKENALTARRFQTPLSEDIAAFDPQLKPLSFVAYPPHGAEISGLSILDKDQKIVNHLHSGENYTITYDVVFTEDACRVAFGTTIKTVDGITVASSTTKGTDQLLTSVRAGEKIHVQHRFTCALLKGTFFINAGVSDSSAEDHHFLHRLVDAYIFRVLPHDMLHTQGIADLGFMPVIERKEG